MVAISTALESLGRDEQNCLVVDQNCSSGDGDRSGDNERLESGCNSEVLEDDTPELAAEEAIEGETLKIQENDRRRAVTRDREGVAARACGDAWRRVRTPMVAISTALESLGRDEQNCLVVDQNCSSGDGDRSGDNERLESGCTLSVPFCESIDVEPWPSGAECWYNRHGNASGLKKQFHFSLFHFAFSQFLRHCFSLYSLPPFARCHRLRAATVEASLFESLPPSKVRVIGFVVSSSKLLLFEAPPPSKVRWLRAPTKLTPLLPYSCPNSAPISIIVAAYVRSADVACARFAAAAACARSTLPLLARSPLPLVEPPPLLARSYSHHYFWFIAPPSLIDLSSVVASLFHF
ncbi:hypothetical protein DEO72_LG6g295 [Vigna unguiculata]|uniref:Uncharacterized protein n=1 Tax=Vigna unguiculata TaxID=3917 RepID=A0A4D6M515_VIGUN|nr:hypothetical protein DEO72_LG6g295 [Vigna unguiculata]